MAGFSIPLLVFCVWPAQAAAVPSKKTEEQVTLQTKLGGKTFEEWDRELKDLKTTWSSKRKAIEQIKPEEASILVRAIEPDEKADSRVRQVAYDVLRMGSRSLQAKALPSLLKQLDDGVPNDTKRMAALMLAEFGEIGEPAIPRLEALAKEREKNFTNYAWVALMKMRSDQVQRYVLKNDPTVVQFLSLYPQCVHFMSYFTGEAGKPSWNSKVGLYGRYELSVQFNLKIDRKSWTAVRDEEPRFHLKEVASIDNARRYVTYNTDSQRRFGLEQWRKLAASKGDLAVLGIAVKKDAPFEGFDRYWKND